MIIPTIQEELIKTKLGFKLIAGLDEAGRGCWAGPVTAAIVIMPIDNLISGVRDSKQISTIKRLELATKIKKQAINYGIGHASHQEIDELGIVGATKLAAKRAYEQLNIKPEYLLTDALVLDEQILIPQESFIKGDQKIYSISCASILAKTSRDQLMKNLPSYLKKYHFDTHKGYGTKEHRLCLDKYGVSNIHRRSFKPVRRAIDESR